MAWLSGLTGKAENFLNSLDQKAASVLTEDHNETNPGLRSSLAQSEPQAVGGSAAHHELPGTSHTPFLSAQIKPSTLSVTKYPESKAPDTTAGSLTPVKSKAGDQAVKKKSDTDAALFEFLNSSEPTERKRSTPGNSTRHSRQSSASSVISNKGGRGSNDGQASSSTSGSSMVHVEMPGRLDFLISF